MKEIDKIALIKIDSGRILVAKSIGKNKFYIPGGKRESGETDEQTLIREVKEEMNVDLQEDTVAYVGTFQAQADGHDEGIIVKMTCYSADYLGEPYPSSEIEEIRWLNYKDLDLVSYVDTKIFAFLKKRGELE